MHVKLVDNGSYFPGGPLVRRYQFEHPYDQIVHYRFIANKAPTSNRLEPRIHDAIDNLYRVIGHKLARLEVHFDPTTNHWLVNIQLQPEYDWEQHNVLISFLICRLTGAEELQFTQVDELDGEGVVDLNTRLEPDDPEEEQEPCD